MNRKVGILPFGLYYAIVTACYLLFEMIPVNYRPVLIMGMTVPAFYKDLT